MVCFFEKLVLSFSPIGRDGWSAAEVREGLQTERLGTPHPSPYVLKTYGDTFSLWEKGVSKIIHPHYKAYPRNPSPALTAINISILLRKREMDCKNGVLQ